MIRNDRECVETLLTLAKQTKNYICENEITFQCDINSMTEDLGNKHFEDADYLIERVTNSLLEDSDKRAALRLTQINEIQVYIENHQ